METISTTPNALKTPDASKTPNAELMAQARESLKGKWGLAVGAFVVVMLLSCVQFIPEVGQLILLVITGPLSVGYATFSIALARGEHAEVAQVVSGFNKFGVSVGAYILMVIFILLWSLLLIIPGIIAALSYSMTYYIIADENLTDPLEALRRSKAMMQGNKWKLFCLGLRFFGWMLLCILTLGIGYLWLAPYMTISYIKFYDDIKNSQALVDQLNA